MSDMLTFTFDQVPASDILPLLLFAIDGSDLFSRSLVEDPTSIGECLSHGPADAHYLFVLNDVNTSLENGGLTVQSITEAFLHALSATPSSIRNTWKNRIHIGSTPLQNDSSFAAVLNQFPRARLTLSFGEHSVARLDCRYQWCPWPDEIQEIKICDAGIACADVDSSDACFSHDHSTFALVQLEHAPSDCTVESAATIIQKAGAAGVIVAERTDASFVPAGRNSAVPGVNIPVSTILSTAGAALADAIKQLGAGDLNATLGYDTVSPGYFVGIDARGMVAEVGWQKFATLEMLAWEADWLHYAASVQRRTAAPALVVPLLDYAPLGGDYAADITMPPTELLSMFSEVEIDFALQCRGTRDADCAVWDHCVSLVVTGCNASNGSAVALGEPGGGPLELGRWVTPFRRRGGRWLTSTELFPMMPGGATCRVQTLLGGEAWYATASLRFTTPRRTSPVGSRHGDPTVFHLTWPNQQTNFDSPKYNENRTLRFSVPPGCTRAVLTALVTGHGDCEFRPSSHHWVINGKYHYNSSEVAYDQYMLAGSSYGCANHTRLGSIPNEHGTWYFGRNGWCDGMDVKPLVFDVTDAVAVTETNVITYSALGYTQDASGALQPTPSGCGGYILMSSSIVFH
eukprot:m.414820 g.414820  ORF g.414820 m.414820 type:complete len:630 (-) comp21275_c1_seq2:3608-5497(-)